MVRRLSLFLLPFSRAVIANNNLDPQAATTNYKEAFALFDKKGTGRVPVSSLGDLLRACGQNPTNAEVEELAASVKSDFDFETFLKVLNRPGGFRDPGDPEEYVRGFQVFDKDSTGFIGVGELKYVLTTLGERLTEEEVSELLKGVEIKNNQVDYFEFVKMVLTN
ncbi:Calmodulin [Orbilia brochopaga]|nr:Calmodulin [Drechslerella brochopaga]